MTSDVRAEIERLRPLAELGEEAFRMNWRNRLARAETTQAKHGALMAALRRLADDLDRGDCIDRAMAADIRTLLDKHK